MAIIIGYIGRLLTGVTFGMDIQLITVSFILSGAKSVLLLRGVISFPFASISPSHVVYI